MWDRPFFGKLARMSPLFDKNVLLGVSGGIAAYKSPDLVRRLAERGANVQVVMTRGAREFVTPLTFQAVSGRPVRSDLWDEEAEAAMGHIELARWADAIVVAPATAEFMAGMAAGKADNLLATLCLASEAPIVVAPAMNRVMWSDPATQDNARVLTSRGIVLAGPAEGDQACGETGSGRMLEPLEIVAEVEKQIVFARQSGPLSGATVMVTAGPTRERLDPVRFLTNRSSGKMGFAVARAAAEAGARVVLVAGPVSLETPADVVRIDVESAEQMHAVVHEHIAGVDIFISAAAVSDYRPASVAAGKIKKTEDEMTIHLVRNPDILSTVGHLPEPPLTVGFAAETHDVRANALDKLRRKRLDMICANAVGDCSEGKPVGFDVDENEIVVLTESGETALGKASKRVLARQLVRLIGDAYLARNDEDTSCAQSS